MVRFILLLINNSGLHHLDGLMVVHYICSPAQQMTGMGVVQRKVGRSAMKVVAPVAVARYNEFMQAVNHHNQLQVQFSSCSRHGFKKYYIKIILALLDMAITNVMIHYFMASPEKIHAVESQAEYMDELVDAMLDKSTRWEMMISSNDIGQGEHSAEST